jgi:uncharacterized protein
MALKMVLVFPAFSLYLSPNKITENYKKMIPRIYDTLLNDHFIQNRQMAFLAGPRQVGKTTTSQAGDNEQRYLNWDNQVDRLAIIKGPDAIAEKLGLNELGKRNKALVFDELHKYSKWKNFLKGFFDLYGKNLQITVTGSARLNVYKHGGDSLMGRYFLYRMHPLSVAEIISPEIIEREIRPPRKIENDLIKQLLQFGGFPEPYIRADTRFYNRWKNLRLELLFNEDLRDLSNIQEISQLKVLAEILKQQAGQLTNYSSFSNGINVSVDTIRRWLSTLEYIYYSFSLRPWFNNVPKSLRKQPKIYLWDWSMVLDKGARNENFIASHLLKAVHFWTDGGFGDYGLFYLRDKNKREVDFLITKNDRPWILVEVKTSASNRLSPHLKYYSQLLKVKHSFQVSMEAPYVNQDCFDEDSPVIVPASTLLSQLI